MKALLWSALVASAIMAAAGEDNSCDTYFLDYNVDCIDVFECGPGGSSISIYENCADGSVLLTAINDPTPTDCDHLTVSGKDVILKRMLNAEEDNKPIINCKLFSPSYLTQFPVVNVNEFKPQVQDKSPIYDVRVPEEGGRQTITTFSYQDEDYGETETLSCELIDGDGNLFEVKSKYENGLMIFSLNTKESLDFEKMMYYRLEYDIKSVDTLGTIMSARQTILVFVDDVGDNPPNWIKTEPSVRREECDAGVSVFQVLANDRDVEVNNEIRYSITAGNEEDYFRIDETTGEVFTAKKIDREELDATTFALTITATEINSDGSVADEPNASTQATNVYIEDINDNEPTFSEPEYYIEIEELIEDRSLDIEIYVKDLDQDSNGTFKITSDKPDDLVISPSQGMGNEAIYLKAKWRGDDTIFDYEKTQDNLTFTLTATEVSDPTHVGTATLVVSLLDINDNKPIFDKSQYDADVSETERGGFLVTSVKAEDSDISPDFGTASIRYSSLCAELNIDQETGDVTLAGDDVLNYEARKTLQCSIEAWDLEGSSSGNSGTTKVKIKVIDVVDEQPSITKPDEATINENTPKDTQVGLPIKAADADEGAAIVFSIDWTRTEASFEGGAVDTDLVKDWFDITKTTVYANEYSAVVNVGSNSPDREKADKIELAILVTDDATQSGNNEAFTFFTINIEDENDEKPTFNGDYTNLNVDEEVPEGTLIVQLDVSDPDVGDTIAMTISDSSLVEVVQKSENLWDLQVSPGARIDRETQADIVVTVRVTDSNGASDEREITITIRDINDNNPVIGQCINAIEVVENEETGTEVAQVLATDADKEGAHGKVRYYLVNDQLDTNTPFAVDAETGVVTVFLEDGERVLDREMKSSWDLVIRANDGCEEGELDCVARTSEPCNIKVTVTDFNDEAPDEFEWNGSEDSFTVYEDMMEGEFVKNGDDEPYKIVASDGDEPDTPNTQITYRVEWVHRVGSDEDLALFEAVDMSEDWPDGSRYYCQLRAATNLTQLKGTYEILLVAEDHGEPKLSGNTTLEIEIKDSNDNPPEFSFTGCLGEKLEIKMQENAYEAGDEVLCSTEEEDTRKLMMWVEDNDEGQNKEFSCEIDYEKSSAIAINGTDQLQEFELKRESDRCVLYVKSVIDRESGRWYNLSLHVIDHGTPSLESWAYLEVIITDAFEAPPYFCLSGLCTQTIYMIENDPGVTSVFMEGIDTDNIDYDPNDSGTYQEVYYDIVGGSTRFFELGGTDRTSNSIQLKNLPKGLDREDTPEYQLFIDVTNDQASQPPIPVVEPRNYTLYLTIKVQDENDNPPEFKKAITIASFTQNDEKGKRIALIQATDADLNETISYDLGNFNWTDVDGTAPSEPFKLGDIIEGSVELILNFKPTGLNSGYCTFPINARDKVGQTHFTTAKVYVITNEYQLPVIFNNDNSMVSEKREDIEEIFTSVYQYSCVVDSTSTQTSDSGEELDGKTAVYMHFIDETKNEPVPKDAIIQQTTDVEVIKELRRKLNEIDLNLNSVGDETIVTESNDTLLLQVLLGVVSLVLGSLVILLLTAYCIRTASLERQVKVLSTNTFGSKESDMNRVGTDMEVVPGSNMFKGEGANPMYNMSEAELRNDETSSIGSGDSVLVGVEDNPEFRNYINRRADGPAPSEQASAGRSIDQVSAPAAFAGATRTNPLLDMDGADERDLSEALRDFELTIRRSSCESDESYGHDNPNFSFGK
ncbi:cadherin-23-like [Penaeus japonicus]|uniref:cadherin-23-like n=1 Tax=Penaeus japonicus TaxID=27405 RepID=UPI001C7112ED|nr:cadherin-23-like [Penaeus japonicus]